MNIHEQVEHLLANLGVEMEHSQHGPFGEDPDGSQPEISIFQSSRDHYGVFYRLDIIDRLPQLRIMLPVEYGPLKMEMYLVRISSQTSLHYAFAGMATYHGSAPFEQGRDASLQHLLYAVAEMMKQLFWAGNLDTMTFPPEIDVRRLL
ncbi:MAG: hypothetical protein NVS3B14_19930 [Ktedonobacteraceae bacterium]